MYSPNYGAQSPELSNNPFINDPSNPHTRWPDISSSNPSSQHSSLTPQGSNQNGMYSPTGMMSHLPGQSFQPSGGFSQPMGSQFNASGFGQMGQLQAQPTGYPGQYQNSFQMGYSGQQQPQSPYSLGSHQMQHQSQFGGGGLQPNYAQQMIQPQMTSYQDVAQFDPYGPISQGWGNNSQQQQQQQQQQPQQQQTTSSSNTYNGQLHPREYIRAHKAELEVWDSYSWRQALSVFDALKDAWTARKKEVEARQAQIKRDYGYTGQQEVDRLQGVWKDADNKFDSVAASTYQMHEVFQNYRQSGDLASKRRVREAVNAALSNLPDWPSQVF